MTPLLAASVTAMNFEQLLRELPRHGRSGANSMVRPNHHVRPEAPPECGTTPTLLAENIRSQTTVRVGVDLVTKLRTKQTRSGKPTGSAKEMNGKNKKKRALVRVRTGMQWDCCG